MLWRKTTPMETSARKWKEEDDPPHCGPQQAALVGSFESAHRESTTRAAIINHVADISVEFATKEAAAKKIMVAERRAARELKRRRHTTPVTPPGKPSGDIVKRRPKRQQR
jgi:hypothetical protein